MASVLERNMQSSALPQSHRHASGSETDEFQVELSVKEIERIVSAMGDLEASLVEAGATTFQVTATADLLDFWNRHLIEFGDRG